MQKFPKIVFKIDCNLDIKVLDALFKKRNSKLGKQSLKWAIEPHPPLKKVLEDKHIPIPYQQKLITFYVLGFYQKNLRKINSQTIEVKRTWENVKIKYFEFLDRIFKGYPWPKGKYVAFPTILGIYSRNIEDKTFQFPYEHSIAGYPLAVIAHEMLHFIFYDYLFKNYPQYRKAKNSLVVWHISEIFNSVIQKTEEWRKIFKVKLLDYPQHAQIIRKLEKKYKHKMIVNHLIDDIIREIDKNKNLFH